MISAVYHVNFQSFKLVPLLCLYLLFGCSNSEKGDVNAVATVNLQPIEIAEFQKAVNRQSFLPGRNLADLENKMEVLNNLIDRELLFQKALKSNYLRKSERLRAEIARDYMDAVLSEVPEPTEEAIKAYYERNKDKMKDGGFNRYRFAIRNILFDEKKSKKKEELLSELRQTARIQIYTDRVSGVLPEKKVSPK